jgi:hypothetical protein
VLAQKGWEPSLEGCWKEEVRSASPYHVG